VGCLNVLNNTITTNSKVNNSEIETQVDVVEVKANPNPYTDKVRFLIQSKVEGNSSLVLYTISGIRIANVYQGYITSRTTRFIDFYVPEGRRGNMIYVLKVGNHIKTGKLINVR
jgi:hypothetical protein